MVSPYHLTVEKGIILLGDEWKKSSKVRKILRGNEAPLSLVDPRSKHVMNYQPDVYFILRNNKKLIFEVLDSEEEKQDIIVADVIRSFLVENVEAIIFVYSGKKAVEQRIMEALVTIAKGLVFKGVSYNEIPFNKSGPLVIPKIFAKSPEMVKNILLRQFKK